jgi:hypothetical protein
MAAENFFTWGAGGAKLTPEQIALARQLLARKNMQGADTSPVGHWTQGAARVADALADVVQGKRLDAQEKDNTDYNSGLISNLLGNSTGAAAPVAGIPAPTASSELRATDPVGEVLAAGGTPSADTPWLRYDNSGATRSQPLAPNLVNALGFLPELGVSMDVFSGGQPTATEGGPRTGSDRHDHGNAADVFFSKDGRRLDWANPQDLPIFEEIVKRGKAAGLTGFGAGDGYMQPGSMHLGFGAPSVWGAGGRGSNAPDWLRNAYAATASAPNQVASIAPQTATDAIAAVAPQQPAPALPPPTTVAAAPPVASVPSVAPAPVQGVQVAQDTGISGQALANAMKVLSDPRANANTKAIAEILVRQQQARQQTILEQQIKQSDPGYQADLRLKNLQADQIANPRISPADQANIDLNREKFRTDQQNRGTLTAAEQADVDSQNARLKLDRDKFDREMQQGQWEKLTDGRLYNKNSGEFRDAPPAVPGSVPAKFDDISGLRKEIQQLPSYKNLSQALPIYRSMAETAGRNSKASDLNLVYGLGKIMDPTSVVREGEMVMVKNTASIPDWLQGAIASLNGGAALTPETRQAIMTEAYGRVNGYDSAFKQDAGQYQGIVERNKFNPADVIPDFGTYEPWKAVAAPTGPIGTDWQDLSPGVRIRKVQ